MKPALARRSTVVVAATLLAGGLTLTAACSAILGVQSGVLEPADASTDGADDATTTDGPANMDAPPTDGAPTSDVAPMADACAARSPIDATGVFVVAGGTDSPTCGTRTAPCATIIHALSVASSQKKTAVYLGPGTYVESITLLAGLTLEGAWDVQGSAWTADCTSVAATLASVEAPPDASVTVLADNLNGTATLRLLSVLGKDPGAVAPGETSYGVFARGATTSLVLDTVVINVPQGGAGVAGDAGAAGAAAPASCPAGDAAAGVAGDPGAASGGGSFTSNGWSPSGGSPGNTGTPGAAGGAGGAGSCTTCSLCIPPSACVVLPPQCAPDGSPGCGGIGGDGGGAGGGGGSSIALYVWGAHVSTIGSFLTAGAGGNGGNGAPGGVGSDGGPGFAGSPTTCSTCTTNGFACTSGINQADGGSPGGAGGAGGAGGNGGGGAGGWSCAYYAGNGGSVTPTSTSLRFGSGGAGGTPLGTAGLGKAACP